MGRSQMYYNKPARMAPGSVNEVDGGLVGCAAVGGGLDGGMGMLISCSLMNSFNL